MSVTRKAAHERRHNDEINRVRTSFDQWSADVCLNENETAIATGMSRAWLKAARSKGSGPQHFLLNGSVVLENVTIQPGGSLVQEITATAPEKQPLRLEFRASAGQPVISGIRLKRISP